MLEAIGEHAKGQDVRTKKSFFELQQQQWPSATGLNIILFREFWVSIPSSSFLDSNDNSLQHLKRVLIEKTSSSYYSSRSFHSRNSSTGLDSARRQQPNIPRDQGMETCDTDSLCSAPSIRISVVKLKLDFPRDQDTETCDTMNH